MVNFQNSRIPEQDFGDGDSVQRWKPQQLWAAEVSKEGKLVRKLVNLDILGWLWTVQMTGSGGAERR